MMRKRKQPPSDIGTRILKRLDKLNEMSPGHTQDWLAEQCGVSGNAVSKWIRDGKIQLLNAIDCARHLRMTVEELVTGEGSLANDMRKVAEDWSILPEPHKANYAKAVAEAADALRALQFPSGPPAQATARFRELSLTAKNRPPRKR